MGEKETSIADNEKQKIKEDLELKRASLKEKEETINYLKTELSVKNDNLSSKEIELTEKKSELDKNAKILEIKEELFKQTEQKYHDLSQSKTDLDIKLGNITKKFREAEEMNEKKEAALNEEKEKNTNLQKIIDELRSKISEKEINLGAVNDNLKATTVSKEETDDKAIHCDICEKKFRNVNQLTKHQRSCTSQI